MLDRDRRLLGVPYHWDRRLGDGATRDSHLALVAADRDDRSIAHIGLGPLRLRPEQIISDHSQGKFDINRAPWWKINALAVEPHAEGVGLARKLLGAAVARMPSEVIGLYGNVEERRTHAIGWYRRQGFYIAASADLAFRIGARYGLKLRPAQGEVFFRGYRGVLVDHLQGRGRPTAEARIAQEQYREEVTRHQKAEPVRGDLGYRLYARRAVENRGQPCRHVAMGPRPLFIYGWDPHLRPMCFDCRWDHLTSIERYDAEDHCDGCQRRREDVVLSWAAVEEDLTVVNAGLCPACRAGKR